MLNYVITNLETSWINLWQQKSAYINLNNRLLTSRGIKNCYVCMRNKTKIWENCWETWIHWNCI